MSVLSEAEPVLPIINFSPYRRYNVQTGTAGRRRSGF